MSLAHHQNGQRRSGLASGARLRARQLQFQPERPAAVLGVGEIDRLEMAVEGPRGDNVGLGGGVGGWQYLQRDPRAEAPGIDGVRAGGVRLGCGGAGLSCGGGNSDGAGVSCGGTCSIGPGHVGGGRLGCRPAGHEGGADHNDRAHPETGRRKTTHNHAPTSPRLLP